MGLLENAKNWFDSQRQEFLTVPVIYKCRDGRSFEVNATIGKTLFRAENEYGTTIRITSIDFIISGLDKEPGRGDRIIHAGRIYEVLAPNGEPVWRWLGSARRVHTKEIGVI